MGTILISASVRSTEYKVKLEYLFTEKEINSEYLLKWEISFYTRGGKPATYILPELTLKPKSTVRKVHIETIQWSGPGWLGMQYDSTFRLLKLEQAGGRGKRLSLSVIK